MHNTNKIIVTLVAAGIAASSFPAAAESGSFEFLGVVASNITSVQMGDTTFASASGAGALTILKSSGPLVAEGTSAVLKCARFSRKSPNAFELEADCAATLTATDAIFLTFKRKTGDITAGSGGSGSLTVTGSGRFASLTGQCQYKVDNLADNWNVTRATCEWKA